MYHCRLKFCFMKIPSEYVEIIRKIPAPEAFEHDFSDYEPSEADVIIAGEVSSEEIRRVNSARKSLSLMIGVCERNRFEELKNVVDEVWELPMNNSELEYRFRRFMNQLKMRMDMWQAENFLNSAIDSSPSLVWFKSRAGIHEKVNKSFCDTVNKTKEQVQGRGHAYIWDVEHDDPACVESDNLVMDSEKLQISEERISTGNGDKLLTTYKAPLYDWDGTVMGTVGVGVDITRERAFEEEIIHRNRTLEKVLTSIECGVLCHSLDRKKIISVNDAALRILGYKSAEEMRKAGFNMVADSVLEEDRPAFREKIRTLKAEGDTVDHEYRVRHKDGEILHVLGNVKILSENGELFYRRFLIDCTEQKLREREHERHSAALVRALSVDFNLVCFYSLVTGLGESLRVNESCNSGFLKSVFHDKISLEESVGLYIENCVVEEDKKMLREALSRKRLREELSERDTIYLNYRCNCSSGERFFQIKAVRTGDWETEPSVVIGLRSVDSEIRKELEKERQLEEALAEANRANHAKSTFLSNMSHDIRTPMNAIMGFTTLALSHPERRDQMEECLKKIMDSGSHLLSLINDILDMSRIESGKMCIEEKPASLSDIIHGLWDILYAEIKSKQLEMSVDAVNIVNEEIICDKLRLDQVLLNLLSNAVKYTPAGGKISFVITQLKEASEGCARYRFVVKDTGIGMSQQFVNHIFEPFERERNTTLSGIQGTGLGMAITKNIIDMMNGVITINSKQGEGTEVIVEFEFRINIDHVPHHEMEEFKNRRALVVDDDFNTCDNVSNMLEQIGMRAERTLSGKEAVLRTTQALSVGDSYDVYIIDCSLTDMNGIEAVRRIRRATKKNAPIIILTAYDWTEFEDEAREAGVSAFCSKPLYMSELERCLSAFSGKDEDKQQRGISGGKIRSGRILLAEDNELNQEIAEALLTEAGFEIEIAENGKAAVEMIKSHEAGYYQVVLMDVQMPIMNGYEAARMIRRLDDKARAEIPVLAMTANAFTEDKEAALACGMNGHIAKPIDINVLLKALDELLQNHEQ